MKYTRPDVFVSVTLKNPSVVLPRPNLLPCAVGEHFFVAYKEYAGEIQAEVVSSIPYPSLPNSFQVDGQKLKVDVLSEDYSPQVFLSLGGSMVDITDRLNFTETAIEKPILSGTINGRPLSGSIFVSYRALSDQYSGNRTELIEASSTSDLIGLFGSSGITPANPLGYGMYNMLLKGYVSASAIAVGDLPDEDGIPSYTGKITNPILSYSYAYDYLYGKPVYGIVPLSNDDFICDLSIVKAKESSSPEGGNPRRVMFCPMFSDFWPVRSAFNATKWFSIKAEGTGGEAVLGQAASVGDVIDVNGYVVKRIATGTGNAYGSFIISGVSSGMVGPVEVTGIQIGNNNYAIRPNEFYLEFPQSVVSPAESSIRVDDIIVIPGKEEYTGDRIYVSAVGVSSSQYFIRCTFAGSKANAAHVLSSNLIVYRKFSPKQKVEGLRLMALSYSEERLLLLGPDTVSAPAGEGGSYIDVPSYFAACQLMAESCRVGILPAGAEPGVEVFVGLREPVGKLFESSRYFTESQLDIAADGGFTWIINTKKGLPLFTRDTITTDGSSVETRDFILGVERDFISKKFKESLAPYLRKYRIDDSLIEKMMMVCGAISAELTDPSSSQYSFRSILVSKIEQDKLRPDTINIEITGEHLYVAKKFNVKINII